jgi:hypothetical protein
MWEKIEVSVKCLSYLSGASIVAAAASSNTLFSAVSAVIFSLGQMVEFAVRASARQAYALGRMKVYEELWARRHTMSDNELEQAFDSIAGESSTPEFVRKLAYNDVLNENGCDPSYAYKLNWLDRSMTAFV